MMTSRKPLNAISNRARGLQVFMLRLIRNMTGNGTAGLIGGAYFKRHPQGTPDAEVIVEDRSHPSTKMLPEVWQRTDEWYDFKENPREKVHVLASLNEKSYEGGEMGDHPIIWYQEYDGGRAWYTGLGHTHEVFQDPVFLEHLLGGLMWAAGVTE